MAKGTVAGLATDDISDDVLLVSVVTSGIKQLHQHLVKCLKTACGFLIVSFADRSTLRILRSEIYGIYAEAIRKKDSTPFRMNRHVCKHHLSIYELLQLLID
ncbi:hypothetical protein T07_2484 [Trichinella nelsoni]|uniref:Uncharacterized protein n=1 Tax=Trichinella nelsoni TaxID=6336 RepID=A0A0V0S0N5_9BILA|nr:hypothetical protein T07_2484 [Trichinella nelsoni]